MMFCPLDANWNRVNLFLRCSQNQKYVYKKDFMVGLRTPGPQPGGHGGAKPPLKKISPSLQIIGYYNT